MDEKLKPLALRVVGETTAEPITINIEAQMADILPECVAKIEAMEYAGGFQHFAQRLASIERTSGAAFFEEPIQKPIRRTLEQLWSSFLKDIKDDKKMTNRLNAMRGHTEQALQDGRTARADIQARYDALSDDQRKYYQTLADQRMAKTTVAVFPNEVSSRDALIRGVDAWIEETIEGPIDKAYAPEFKHMAYIGDLFNETLPFLRKKMEGYVKPLIEGRRNYSNYIPVTATIIQADIVAYLEQASKLAETFAELGEKRFDTNELARKSVEK